MARGPRKTAEKQRVVAVDLFCGVAGLSYGLQQSGIEIAAGIDLDPACRFPFEENIGAKFIEQDVAQVTSESVTALFEGADIRLLAGCAPCQPFSGYTTKRREIDLRWRLLLEFLRIAVTVRPEIVTLENVPRLIHLPLWREFLDGLKQAGYHVSWKVVDASEYGVCQRRKRLVLLASLLGEIDLPDSASSDTATVRSAIGSLPAVPAGVKGNDDSLHCARALTGRNLSRIRLSKPAGTWRQWPARMRVACHKTESGKTYPSVYGRMSWDAPAPTITTQFYGFGNGRFGHPEQDRAITLREGALLQSFPPQYKFIAPNKRVNFREVGRLIGNAVPPLLARAIGDVIVRHSAAFSK